MRQDVDFWVKISSGGSYGHTCYVAKELAAASERFVAFTAHRYALLDRWGLRQVVVDAPSLPLIRGFPDTCCWYTAEVKASGDHVVALARIPKESEKTLKPGVVYSYDLAIAVGGTTHTLASLGLLAAGYLRQAVYTTARKPPGVI